MRVGQMGLQLGLATLMVSPPLGRDQSDEHVWRNATSLTESDLCPAVLSALTFAGVVSGYPCTQVTMRTEPPTACITPKPSA